jgi:high-affinity iron transporter
VLGALVIVFREVIEAGLIIGIVLAATRGVPGRSGFILGGISAGLIGASLMALFAERISNAFEGAGQELLNATVLGVAVVMLMWHNAWMARHGREMTAKFNALGRDVRAGARPMMALAMVVGLAVLREGFEVVLFLAGVVASGTSGMALLAGGLLGVAAGGVFTAMTYFGLLAIPTRHIFTVTSVVIALLAAGMAAQAAHFLDAAGLVSVLGGTLWDTSGILPENGILGRLLHTLVGYSDRPTELQLIVYLATLAAMVVLMRLAAPRHSAASP